MLIAEGDAEDSAATGCVEPSVKMLDHFESLSMLVSPSKLVESGLSQSLFGYLQSNFNNGSL